MALPTFILAFGVLLFWEKHSSAVTCSATVDSHAQAHRQRGRVQALCSHSSVQAFSCTCVKVNS